jgi:hypothetical protein
LPECQADFILVQLLEIGPQVAAGMGSAAIGWPELRAWQTCMGVSLPPWQARLLIELAREYNGFSQQATKPDCPAPWAEEAQIEGRREAIARNLRMGFRALMMARGDKKGA